LHCYYFIATLALTEHPSFNVYSLAQELVTPSQRAQVTASRCLLQPATLTFLPILLVTEKQVTDRCCLVVPPGEKQKHWLRFK